MLRSLARSIAGPVSGIGFLLLTACSTDPAGPDAAAASGQTDPVAKLAGDRVAICHVDAARPAILQVGTPALADHLSHGDYVTTLLVSRQTDLGGDGVHFRRIGDALDAARAGRLTRGELETAACRITIVASAEEYPGSTGPASPDLERFPLFVDVPDITLRGALAMQLDGNGRAAGATPGAGETTLAPVAPLPVVGGSSTPLVVANAHPGGSAGHGLVVEGFVLQSGYATEDGAGGQGVLSVRAERVTIRGNRFEAGFTESVDIRAGSADVMQNELGGTRGTCDICLAGPGSFRAVGNRLAAGGIPGITVDGVVDLPLPQGVEPLAIPAAAQTWAEIRNNEVRDHQRKPVGVGIRVDALGVGAPDVHNTVRAVIRENLLVNNRFGIIVHGAFPRPGTALRSDVDVTLGGNRIEQSCQAKLLVSFSRHTTALGLTSNPWLLGSTFQLALGGDLSWEEAWVGHPDGFGNTLTVDGHTIANGTRQFYDDAGCPGL